MRETCLSGCVGLALSDAESTIHNRYPKDHCRFPIATLLSAIGKAGLVNVEPRLKRLERRHKVH